MQLSQIAKTVQLFGLKKRHAGSWLGRSPFRKMEKYAGTFSRHHGWVFVGPCHPCAHGPPAKNWMLEVLHLFRCFTQHTRFYTHTLLHTDAFTRRRFYTQTLLHADTFTHRRFYTQALLHINVFTHRRFYTQAVLHTETFTHRRFWTRQFGHSESISTHRLIYTLAQK